MDEQETDQDANRENESTRVRLWPRESVVGERLYALQCICLTEARLLHSTQLLPNCGGRKERIKRKPQYLQEYVMLSYNEAISGEDKDKLLKAIEEEKSSLKKNGVFQFVDLLMAKKSQEIRSLKQAPRAWNKIFVDFLKTHDITDKLVFVNDEGNLILAIGEDDGVVISNQNDKIDEFIIKFQTEFKIEITDNPELFVGLEIENARGFININQESYVDQLLTIYNMDCTKPATTPAFSGTDNSEDCDGMYLQGTRNLQLGYSTDLNTSLIDAYSGADYAGDETSRRSTSGYVILYMGSLIAWSTKKNSQSYHSVL
ncbi:hypothetical protein PR048_025283 [Dryococelus australis]|uniref:Reverse transcriptase Ty1/copia-type domain-containing protein n=1 Tax=Dryococelus australis TaxID=614101 RepID=A0ABQ9GR00_9NEOP|nr:hypothetical protein PR048_025283 [Dryococelus australis]